MHKNLTFYAPYGSLDTDLANLITDVIREVNKTVSLDLDFVNDVRQTFNKSQYADYCNISTYNDPSDRAIAYVSPATAYESGEYYCVGANFCINKAHFYGKDTNYKFRYSVLLHEFGHLLGLVDMYQKLEEVPSSYKKNKIMYVVADSYLISEKVTVMYKYYGDGLPTYSSYTEFDVQNLNLIY